MYTLDVRDVMCLQWMSLTLENEQISVKIHYYLLGAAYKVHIPIEFWGYEQKYKLGRLRLLNKYLMQRKKCTSTVTSEWTGKETNNDFVVII